MEILAQASGKFSSIGSRHALLLLVTKLKFIITQLVRLPIVFTVRIPQYIRTTGEILFHRLKCISSTALWWTFPRPSGTSFVNLPIPSTPFVFSTSVLNGPPKSSKYNGNKTPPASGLTWQAFAGWSKTKTPGNTPTTTFLPSST